MEKKFDIKMLGEGTVYMKPIAVADLPADMQAQIDGSDEIIVVHNHHGERIAFIANEQLAFELAREYRMNAVRVH